MTPDEAPPPLTPEQRARAGALVLSLEGFEGPIDVLLTLARDQKVDLARLSILALAEQYLAFVAAARALNLDLAADYLVMAAWLAFLKSRLLVPTARAEVEEPSADAMAEALQFQLRRLEAMQDAGQALMARLRLGWDLFPRGAPEGIAVRRRPVYQAGLPDLLRAYGAVRRRRDRPRVLAIEPFDLYSVEDALARIERMLGRLGDWTPLADLLPPVAVLQARDRRGRGAVPLLRRSALAATFVAALELARQGRVDLRQDGGPDGPLVMRARQGGMTPESTDAE